MNPIIPTIFITLAILIFQHVKSGDAINASWLAAYALFCAPSLLLWVSSLMLESRSIHFIFAAISSSFIVLWLYMLAVNDKYLVMPASAMSFLAIAIFVLLLALIYRLFVYVKRCLNRT
ncbi:MAG: hypothetical protein ACKVN9_01925 [Methylophilaceae bacterium]